MTSFTAGQIIKILPPRLTALIAAGEVVERPASVVKELLENALDAGAKAISVEVQDGGLSLIRVGDDGLGISRADAPLALRPFATSKISAPADLNAIRTYGFRGEALSSIAAVAQVEILARTQAELEGTRLISRYRPEGEPWENVEVTPAASPVGTRVTVSGLFAAMPARRKFLKAPLRELQLLQNVTEKYTLAHPQVAFRLLADGRPRLALPPGSLKERIGGLWGRDIADEMVGVDWQAMDLHIQGYISSPEIARSRRDRQYFYVNDRPIRSGLLAVMLERPYAGRLPPGRYPLAVLNISIDPGFVDINIHPQKADVRFSRERSIYGALTQAINEALSDFPRHILEDMVEFPWPFTGVDAGQQGFDLSALREDGAPYQAGPLRPVAQIHLTYILAQSTDGLLIIDQHAAHEQILYERLSAAPSESADVGPLQIQLTPTESTLLGNHLSLFAGLGFDLELFGSHTYMLRRIPAVLRPHLGNQVTTSTQPLEAALLTTLLEELAKHKTRSQDDILDKIAQKAACVCAIKSGDHLADDQMQTLLNDLIETWSPAACPHGRPVFVNLSLAEIDRRFGRR